MISTIFVSTSSALYSMIFKYLQVKFKCKIYAKIMTSDAAADENHTAIWMKIIRNFDFIKIPIIFFLIFHVPFELLDFPISILEYSGNTRQISYLLMLWLLGPVSISDKTSYCKISQSLKATRFVFRIVQSLWNLTGTSAAGLPKCLSNFKAMR